MVDEIRIYAEGGGDSKETRASLRRGFGEFFSSIKEVVRSKRIRWRIITCGGRNSAYEDFKNALNTHSEAFNILLVDSENLVRNSPWEHLKNRDGWDNPGVNDDHCHLMVQTMESWIVADIDSLEKFYGNNFRRNQIPKRRNVELIDKKILEKALDEATKNTQKGKYHKTKHAPILLEEINPNKVRDKAKHCNRLFTLILERITN